MNEAISKVYGHFADAVRVYIPVEARLISDDIYQLLPDREFDYDDAAKLFEFGSHDIVRTKEIQWDDGTLGRFAFELLEASNPRNSQKRLLIQILLQEPDPQSILESITRSEIKSLCQTIEEAPFMYPNIKNWLVRNKDKIENMI